MSHPTDHDRTTRLIITWCSIGMDVCRIILKLTFIIALGFAWLLFRIAKR